MKNAVKIINKKTGDENVAIYAANRLGNMRYHVDGRFLTDKQFNNLYTIKNEKGN